MFLSVSAAYFVARKEVTKTLYKRKDSIYWWCYYKHPVTGLLIKTSTKETDEKKARKVLEQIYRQSLYDCGKAIPTLGELLVPYETPSSNPRYVQAQIDGYNYGYNHAVHVACSIKCIHELLKSKAPALLSKKISLITASDIKTIKALLVKLKGRSGAANKDFSNLKTVFAQAHEDGLLDQNITDGMRNIKYEKKERLAFDCGDIADIISLQSKFDEMGLMSEWAFFTVAATTGMRRAEIMALNESQIDDDIILIDRAIKVTEKSREDVGTPKWDYKRTIPVSRITINALSVLKTDINGRFFHDIPYRWVDEAFDKLMTTACCMFPDRAPIWNSMTAHTLRHSLASNLFVAGVPPYIIKTYLGWEHGLDDIIGTQKRYTHIYARNLFPVPRLVNRLYEPDISKRIELKTVQVDKNLLSQICEEVV